MSGQAAQLEIENKDHIIEAAYEPGSTITLDGTRYTLDQFYFHTRSEHAVAGQHTPMELHLVHKSAAIAVVGVLLEEG